MALLPKKKILIADASAKVVDSIRSRKEFQSCEIETASCGISCLEKAAHFKPDLLILDLMLPGMHAVEILQKISQPPVLNSPGVFILTAYPVDQYHLSRLSQKPAYYISKPLDLDLLTNQVEAFFSGTLSLPIPTLHHPHKESTSYSPKAFASGNYIKFWGTRGSLPVSGKEHIRYGGNTSCLEIRCGNDCLILDGGSGIRALGQELILSDKKKFDVIISHTHWDHIMGFPFFAPLYRKDAEINVYSPVGYEKTLKEVFAELLNYNYFPVCVEDLGARLHYHEVHAQNVLQFGSIRVHFYYAYHPGSTVCFKIEANGKKIGYITDNEFLMGYVGHPNEVQPDHPLLENYRPMIEAFKDCDLIIHEAQYFPEEYQKRIGWGHSSVTNAAVLIKYTGCKEWIVTHHDPQHSDETLKNKFQLHLDILKECHPTCRARFAYDGLIIPL